MKNIKDSKLLKFAQFSKYLLVALLNIFGYMLYAISFIIPRRKDIWVFGSWSGKRFSDNSKYIFLYIANNGKNISPIWISKNKEIIKKLRENKYRAYYAYELKGIYYNLRAKYIFSDSYFDSINFWCSGGATKIQLWHGIPLKKIEHDAKNLPWNRSIFSHLIYLYMAPWLFSKNDYIISSSDLFTDIFSSAFQIEKERIIVTGYPRNDPILNKAFNKIDILDSGIYEEIIKIRLNNNAKLIFYLPTFRDSNANGDELNNILDFKRLDNFLESINCFLIIKLHPNIKNSYEIKHLNRIKFLPNYFDPYVLLNNIDILITDYSSIYFDYLLMNKPIIFFAYDLQKYLKDDRELYFNYDNFTPGPKSFTFEDLLQWIDYFAKGNDKFSDFRKKIRDISFKYIDGNASDRIYKFILHEN